MAPGEPRSSSPRAQRRVETAPPHPPTTPIPPRADPVPAAHLGRVVEDPLLPGLLLVGDHGLRDLVSERGAHVVQHAVQPHLHLRTEGRGATLSREAVRSRLMPTTCFVI